MIPPRFEKILRGTFSIMMKRLAIVGCCAAFLSACTTTDPYTGEQKVSNTAGGALIGAGVGALAGLAVGGGNAVENRRAALIGAGIGALGGGAIGNYMDQQEAELRRQLQGTGISVTRNGDNIILNMPSNVTFDIDQAAVKPQFYQTLNSVALVLKKFNKTLVDINGHTDSTGSLAHNQQLSEQRAISVASYLINQGVEARRMSAVGFGPNQPIATNATEAGRAANRRVEVQISPLRAG